MKDCPVGRGKYVVTGDYELAIFHLIAPDRFVVVRNSCPHAGGNLAAGEVTGATVTCPWHQWPFDLDSGVCTLSDSARLRPLEVCVEEGWVCVRLPAG